MATSRERIFPAATLPAALSLAAIVAACSPSRDNSKSERQRGREAKHANHAGGKLKKLDKNGDGIVTAAEIPAGKERRFKKLDANGDGQLTGDELERKSKRSR